MILARATPFQSHRAQAVRLPKDVALPEAVRSVMIVGEGKHRVIIPGEAAWDDVFDPPGVDRGLREQPRLQPDISGSLAFE